MALGLTQPLTEMCVCVCVYTYVYIYTGHVVAQLVEALSYKSEGRGFDSR